MSIGAPAKAAEVNVVVTTRLYLSRRRLLEPERNGWIFSLNELRHKVKSQRNDERDADPENDFVERAPTSNVGRCIKLINGVR